MIPNADNANPMPDTDEDLFDGDPIPLTQSTPIPAFPVDMLPGPIAEMVHAVAEATQTDPAMPATSVLSALAACTGGHAEIEIRGGWREPLNLYTATIAAPGERKSAVQLAMVRPLLDAEQLLADTGVATRLESETRKQVAEKAAEKLKHEAAKAASTDNWDTAMAEAIGAAQIAASIEVPAVPRLVADDITPEAAASVLAEQGGRLAIITAEGGIFDIIAGRYSNNIPNMDVWLKGHSGDPMKVDRKGRPPEYIRRPALTLGLMLQPAVLNAIAANRQFRGRGLLARILYAYPVSKVGYRAIAPASPDQTTIEGYEAVMKGLAAGMAGWQSDPA
ncbi:YfjI family protein, partial [Mycobacterium sp.]|uniref:YfjI family protein n=1 Tax=Mycobacterium sp. TaxID=1785 RepID=UPI003F97E570